MKKAHALRNRPTRRSHRCFRKIHSAVNSKTVIAAMVSLIALSFAAVALAVPLAAPNWVGPTEVESDDGYAELRWETTGSEPVDLFQIEEKAEGPPRSGFITGLSQLFYRTDPGEYEFRVRACSKLEVGDINCGPWSNKLTLTVTEEIYGGELPVQETESSKDLKTSSAVEALSSDVFGGPDQLQPGMWWNSTKPGHGWSFYWANQLALPSMPSNAYDLYAIFFTYEAKTTQCMGNPSEPCNPNLGLSDYRPVVLDAKLALTNGIYQGALKVNQSDGTAPIVGWLKVTFTANNKRANIDWSADFRFESLDDIETIDLLFDDGHEVSAPSDLSGRWTSSGTGFQPYIVENIGHDIGEDPHGVEVVEVVFLDDGADYAGTTLDVLGRAAWIQAESFPPTVIEENTDLCFFHAKSGYKPTLLNGTVVWEYGSCGRRNFSNYETEQVGFRIDYTMPGFDSPTHAGGWVPGGTVSLGNWFILKVFQKSSHFHRIWFNGAGSCEINGTTPSCAADVTWFTDGDFPQATAYAYNQTTGVRGPSVTASEPVMEHELFDLEQAGTYVFELRMNNSPTSRLIAKSSPFTVEQGSGGQAPSSPATPQGQWSSCPDHSYTISWTHSSVGSVDNYQLEESRPGLSTLTHTVSPGTTTSKSFTKSSGPFGTYSYRVRACNSFGCSAYTTALQWSVPESCSTTIEHPWGDNAYGTLGLNQSGHYALGYHFVPLVDGQVLELGGLFNGTKHVKLFDRATQVLLADVVVTSANQFAGSYVTLPQPVSLVADREYTVAMYSEGVGYSYYNPPTSDDFPDTFGNIKILAGTSASTSFNPNAIPTNSNDSVIYGQPDIGFVPDGVPPTNQDPEFPNGVNPPGLANTAVVDFRTPISDPDGDSMTCGVTGNLPSGLSLSTVGNAECVISGVANAGVQNHSFTLTVSDGNGGSASASVNWQLKNTPPFFDATITSLQFTRNTQDTRRIAGDVDPGQTLTCSLTSGALPAGLSLSNDPEGYCVLSGLTTVQPGTYIISLSVSDGVTTRNSGSISLEVTN